MSCRVVSRLCLLLIGLSGFNVIWQRDSLIAQERPVSRIADLMATPPDQLVQQKDVRIRGMVSLIGDGITTSPRAVEAAQSFCIEDPSAGIWVRSGHAIRQGVLRDSESVLPQLDYGVEVELEGRLDKGGFAPVILPTRIKILGKGKLPSAYRALPTRFLNGADELRRVTVNGVVQSIDGEAANWWSLRVETGVGHFITRIPKVQEYSRKRLLDAEVDLTGVAAVVWNWRSEFVCPRLIIAHQDDIHILRPASDPFDAEQVSIAYLDSYAPSGRPRHRRRIQGTVTYYDGDQLLYVQENGIGIQVRLNEPVAVRVGDRVEVSGFIDTSRYLAGLRGALVRRLGQSEDLTAVPITIAQVIQEHQGSWTGQPINLTSYDGLLIRVSGRLMDFQIGTPPEPHRLEIDCGDSVTTAFLSGGTRELLPGTEVEVTGIARLVFSPPVASAGLAKPDRIDLLLRDGNDILVVGHPSWWTVRRTFYALLMLAGVALLAFGWAFTIRRTLNQRTNQLAHEMRNRRDAALEFQAAIHERTRLAANLHDTLLQTLAGIAYQIEACGLSKEAASRGHLETARRMVQHGQEDLRNTVWALHCLPLSEGPFVDSVKQVTTKFAHGQDTAIRVDCATDFPKLPDFVAGNLLLVIQEAVHNAIKHARAETIDVELCFSPAEDRLSVLVRDDGAGFDVANRKTSSDGHFGVEGMEQRIERIGGTLVIESRHGIGTTIHAEVPLRDFDPMIA